LVRAIGAVPYGTSRTQEKIERARPLGLADGVALAGDFGPLKDKIEDWTAGRGFDVILDLVGGAYVPAGIEALAARGRMVLLATMGGRKTEIDLALLLRKRLHLMGSVLRSRSLEEKIAATRAFAAEVVPPLAQRKLRPIIDREFGFTTQEARAAYSRLESNESFGKVVLQITA
jgi:NADPH:quinone reductase-like Zn-dependent oxidoreductase